MILAISNGNDFIFGKGLFDDDEFVAFLVISPLNTAIMGYDFETTAKRTPPLLVICH